MLFTWFCIFNSRWPKNLHDMHSELLHVKHSSSCPYIFLKQKCMLCNINPCCICCLIPLNYCLSENRHFGKGLGKCWIASWSYTIKVFKAYGLMWSLYIQREEYCTESVWRLNTASVFGTNVFLVYCVQFWYLQFRRYTEKFEEVKQRNCIIGVCGKVLVVGGCWGDLCGKR